MINTVATVLLSNSSEASLDQRLCIILKLVNYGVSLDVLKVMLYLGENHLDWIVLRTVRSIVDGKEPQLFHLVLATTTSMHRKVIEKQRDFTLRESSLEKVEELDELLSIHASTVTLIDKHTMLPCDASYHCGGCDVEVLGVNLYVDAYVAELMTHDGPHCKHDFIQVNDGKIAQYGFPHLKP